MMLDILRVKSLAQQYGFVFIEHQENVKMLSFKKSDIRINVYYSKGTIATAMAHPKKGKTQLFRRVSDEEQLEIIFRNPRTHTGVGYYKREKYVPRKRF